MNRQAKADADNMVRQRPRPLLYQLVRYDLAANKLSIEDNILPAIQIAGILNPIDAMLDQVPDSLHIFLGHSINKQAQRCFASIPTACC